MNTPLPRHLQTRPLLLRPNESSPRRRSTNEDGQKVISSFSTSAASFGALRENQRVYRVTGNDCLFLLLGKRYVCHSIRSSVRRTFPCLSTQPSATLVRSSFFKGAFSSHSASAPVLASCLRFSRAYSLGQPSFLSHNNWTTIRNSDTRQFLTVVFPSRH